jgi:hypothetical protein
MSQYVSVELRRAIRNQFHNRCAYCETAEHLTVAIFEVEHIVPRAKSGETVLENLCLACPSCNRYKNIQQTAIDPQTKQNVPLFHPQKDSWQAHFSWHEHGTEIIGLTPTGRATISALRMNRPQLVRVRKMWVAMAEHPPS